MDLNPIQKWYTYVGMWVENMNMAYAKDSQCP